MPGADRDGLTAGPADRLQAVGGAIVALDSGLGHMSDPFYGAKTVVVVLVDRSVPTHLEDGSLAMGNLLNAAYALGVDSCWIHRAHEVFDSPEGLELLASWGLPADGSLRGVGHCILGYAEDTLPEPKPRRDNIIYVR